jgi:hypothetical protein
MSVVEATDRLSQKYASEERVKTPPVDEKKAEPEVVDDDIPYSGCYDDLYATETNKAPHESLEVAGVSLFPILQRSVSLQSRQVFHACQAPDETATLLETEQYNLASDALVILLYAMKLAENAQPRGIASNTKTAARDLLSSVVVGHRGFVM